MQKKIRIFFYTIIILTCILFTSFGLNQSVPLWAKAKDSLKDTQKNNKKEMSKPSGYEAPRTQLKNIIAFSYKEYLAFYDTAKGEVYLYRENIYVKTLRIAEPGANLMILY